MSQSPDPSKPSAEYEKGWQQINAFLRQGRTWSGNERNVVFLNTGTDRFANISAVSGLDFVDDARGLASVDWDHDGDLDLWIRNRTAPRVRLMLNQTTGAPSVALRLRGVTSNRDGVGARVEMQFAAEDTAPLVRFVTAGDGFRSQSSKWLHFGLASAPAIAGVIVDWPGGARERFDGIAADGRYLLQQGTGQARMVEPRSVSPQLATEERPAGSRPATHPGISRRIPIAPMTVQALDDGEDLTIPTTGRPTLLNLWASWCTPCVEELTSFRDAHARLSEAGLEIVAVTVEELDPDSPTTLADARDRLEELDFPFHSARANKALLEGLQRIEGMLFARVREPAVPTSYLFDARGRLAAIYRGKVEIDTLLRDLERLPLEGAELMAEVLPFPGRTLNPFLPVEVFLPGMAAAQLDDDPESASSLLQSAIAFQIERRAKGLLNSTQRSRLEKELAANHVQLGRAFAALERVPEAAESYQAALLIDRRQADAMSGLGALLSAAGRYEQSLQIYQQAFNIRPADPAIRTNLGICEMYAGDIRRAVDLFTTLVQETPNSADAQFNLGIALRQLGQSREALGHLNRSVELNSSGIAALTELAWLLATERDGTLRDGPRAVTLAERARFLADSVDATILDTLAAAYAASGKFEDAQTIAQQAQEQARKEQNPALARFIGQRILGYQRGRPFRE